MPKPIAICYDVIENPVEVLAIVDQGGGRRMARKTRKKDLRVPLSEIKDDLSKYLRLAGRDGIVITRHGRPAGVLIGFESDEDWFDYRLENDPASLDRVRGARESLRAGSGTKLEDVPR